MQAHETHGQYLRNYQYDSLGNLTYEWNDNNVIIDYKLNNLNQITTKTDDNWKTHTDYTYDNRGNTLQKIYYKNSKETVMGAYEYDETNRMVKGTNDLGEQSIYHFNGLGMLATNEWLIKKNAYGYHDVAVSALTEVTAQDGSDSEIVLEEATGKAKVKSKKAAEEVAASPELNKTSHVVKDFVLDYNSYGQENLMEYELYDEGLTYRYVYGVDKLGVTAYTVPNGSASVTTAEGDLPLYYHMDHMGSSEFLTSDVTQRITSWTSYDEWGNITHNAVLKCGERELDLVKTYTGHERDSVLGMYYAKARMYDTADKHGSTKANKLGDKRFTAVDPVKGDVRNPQSLVQYTYVINNPLMYTDPLGEMPVKLLEAINVAYQHDKINEDEVAKIVLVMNMLAGDDRNSVLDKVMSMSPNAEVWTVYEEVEPELADKKNPTVQATNVAFHEIAQILAAKEIKKADRGQNTTYPGLEVSNAPISTGEMDIFWRGNVWEVKPYGSTAFNSSLKKYIPLYQQGKERLWYLNQGATRWPGYTYTNTSTAKLFEINNVKYDIHVESVGKGKIQYYITMNCDRKTGAKVPANAFAAEMKTVKNNMQGAILAGAVSLVLTVDDFIPVLGQLDNVIVAERVGTASRNLVNAVKTGVGLFAY